MQLFVILITCHFYPREKQNDQTEQYVNQNTNQIRSLENMTSSGEIGLDLRRNANPKLYYNEK